VTAALWRPMNRSKDLKLLYKKSDHQKSWQTVPRRSTCGGSYTLPCSQTMPRTAYPRHIMRRTTEQFTPSRRTHPLYRSRPTCLSSVHPTQHILATSRPALSLRVLLVRVPLDLARLRANTVKSRITKVQTDRLVGAIIQSFQSLYHPFVSLMVIRVSVLWLTLWAKSL
jgi:hypothetical protein